MIGPTDLLQPSPAPDFNISIFQLHLVCQISSSILEGPTDSTFKFFLLYIRCLEKKIVRILQPNSKKYVLTFEAKCIIPIILKIQFIFETHSQLLRYSKMHRFTKA